MLRAPVARPGPARASRSSSTPSATPSERRAHRGELIALLRAPRGRARRRRGAACYTNPLRILDSKNPAMQEMIERRRGWSTLWVTSRAHLRGGAGGACATAGIAFRIDPRLVRGLDYYNRTVFELVTTRLGAQGTVCAGGRYDGLFEQLGGKPTPACGFGIGVERLILLLQDAGREVGDAPLAYVVHAGEAAARLAWRVAEMLRDARPRRRAQRGRRQLQVADETGRWQRRGVCADHRRRRSRRGRGERQAAARRRRTGRRVPVKAPGRSVRTAQRRADAHSTREAQWQSTISKNRTSSRTSRRGGSSGATTSPEWSAVCVGIVGVQGWRWWQHSQAEQASVLYSAISTGGARTTWPRRRTRCAARRQVRRHRLRAARGADRRQLLFDNGDKAGAKPQLQWVIDRSGEDELQQIARYRLAEVQFDDKQYDDALRTLDAKHDEPFAGLYADLRGDILAAAGRARRRARRLPDGDGQLDAKSPYRSYVQVKLDAAGGPAGRRRGQRAGPRAPRAAAGARPPLRRPVPRNERKPNRARAAAGIRARRLRGVLLPAIGRDAADLRRLLVAVVVDPDDPGAVVRLALAGARRRSARCPRFKATVTPRRSSGRSTSAGGARASRPASRRTAIYAAAIDGTIVRVEPGHRRDGLADQTPGTKLAGRRRRRRDAARGRHGRRATCRLRPRRQAAVAGEGQQRSDRARRGRRGRGRRLVGRRPHLRARRRRRQDQVGLPAQQPAADRAQLPPAASSAAAACSPAPPAASCSPSTSRPATSRWEGNVATPKGATELERIADITSLPVIDERAGVRGRVPGPASRASTCCAARSSGRATCRASAASPPTTATSTSPTTRAPCTRSTRRPAARSGSRTSSRPGSRAARSSSATTSRVVDVEGYLHLIDRNDGTLVGGSAPTAAGDRATRGLGPQRGLADRTGRSTPDAR